MPHRRGCSTPVLSGTGGDPSGPSVCRGVPTESVVGSSVPVDPGPACVAVGVDRSSVVAPDPDESVSDAPAVTGPSADSPDPHPASAEAPAIPASARSVRLSTPRPDPSSTESVIRLSHPHRPKRIGNHEVEGPFQPIPAIPFCFIGRRCPVVRTGAAGVRPSRIRRGLSIHLFLGRPLGGTASPRCYPQQSSPMDTRGLLVLPATVLAVAALSQASAPVTGLAVSALLAVLLVAAFRGENVRL